MTSLVPSIKYHKFLKIKQVNFLLEMKNLTVAMLIVNSPKTSKVHCKLENWWKLIYLDKKAQIISIMVNQC